MLHFSIIFTHSRQQQSVLQTLCTHPAAGSRCMVEKHADKLMQFFVMFMNCYFSSLPVYYILSKQNQQVFLCVCCVYSLQVGKKKKKKKEFMIMNKWSRSLDMSSEGVIIAVVNDLGGKSALRWTKWSALDGLWIICCMKRLQLLNCQFQTRLMQMSRICVQLLMATVCQSSFGALKCFFYFSWTHKDKLRCFCCRIE